MKEFILFAVISGIISTYLGSLISTQTYITYSSEKIWDVGYEKVIRIKPSEIAKDCENIEISDIKNETFIKPVKCVNGTLFINQTAFNELGKLGDYIFWYGSED